MDTDLHDYAELAHNILRKYLRSAIIIDDQWPDAQVAEADIDEPDESDLIEDEDPLELTDEAFTPTALVPKPESNPADARLLAELQKSLLQDGLLACGFRYRHQDRDLAVSLAQSADMVVLDWHLVGDDGAEALSILDRLVGNELRFICIFTGHGRVGEIRLALEGRLGPASGFSFGTEGDLRIQNLVIAIRNKEGLEAATTGLTVAPEELLEAALNGLTSSYNGLVQLAMLELTQLHRQQLPSILERLDGKLDTAVLLEAGDIASPVGQRGAFLAVLMDEWRAHLEQGDTESQALGQGGRTLRARQLAENIGQIGVEDLRRIFTETGVKEKAARSIAENRSVLEAWLRDGCNGTGPSGRGITDAERPLVGWAVLRAASSLERNESALPLLRLDSLFHQQFELPKELTQGTLVAVETDSQSEALEYYLCITPACDAVRPEKIGHLFTFLKARPFDPTILFEKGKIRGESYCVVGSEDEMLCLEFLVKQKLVLKVVDRVFDSQEAVYGSLPTSGGSETRNGAVLLKRIVQLRMEHALSIAAAVSADSSRVGVNRVEFLRSRLS